MNRRSSTLYDRAGRGIASINPLGQRTSTVYDAAGESIASIDPLGRRSSTVYDQASRGIASINPLGQRSTTVYDAAGESNAQSRRSWLISSLSSRSLRSPQRKEKGPPGASSTQKSGQSALTLHHGFDASSLSVRS